MNEFVASNGVQIRLEKHGSRDGDLDFKNNGPSWLGMCGGPVVQALREFFQAEADERLSRWRSTAEPAWTAVVDSGPSLVCFRHDDGLHEFSVHLDGAGLSRWTRELQAVAREYFDAHPEPEPWHDAAAGEVWLIAFSDEGGGGRLPWTVNRAGNFTHPLFANDVKPADSTIVDGRRIWPAEVS